MIVLLLRLILVFEFISFLASLTLYYKKKPSLTFKFFPYFLLVTVIIETIGSVYNSKRVMVVKMYNYFSVVEIVFYLFVLYHTIQNKRVKQFILFTGILYPVIAVTNIALQEVPAFHFNTYSPGAILLVSLCVYYIFELFKNPVIKKPANEPAFWICLGLLIFYSCTLPITGGFSFIKAPKKIEHIVVSIILSVTNYILYSCFTIGFCVSLKQPEHIKSETKLFR